MECTTEHKESDVRPFEYISTLDADLILNLLQWEHPQTIALVLSQIPPPLAAAVLQELHHEVQSDVMRRIAVLAPVDPSACRAVERALEKNITRVSSIIAGGIPTSVEILNLVDKDCEKQVIEALEDEDPELAEEIKQRMFIFEDIVMLDDKTVQKCFREMDSQDLTKALMNVDTEVQDKIFRNMGKRAAQMIKEDMVYLGQVRLKEIEEAQSKIVSIIRHLEDTGEISTGRFGEDELVSSNIEIEEKKSLIKKIWSLIRKFIKDIITKK